MTIRFFRYTLSVLLLAFFSAPICAAKKPPVIEEALRRLDVSLNAYEYRVDTAFKKVDNYKELLCEEVDTVKKIGHVKNIVNGYLHRNVDSVLAYSALGERLASSIGDKNAEMSFKIGAISSMPLKGHIHETIVLIDSMMQLPLSHSLRLDLFKSARLAYMKILSIYSNYKIDEFYLAKFFALNDSVLKYEHPDSGEFGKYLGTHYMGRNRPNLAYEALTDYLETVDSVSNEYVEGQSLLATLSYLRGRNEDWIFRTIMVAESEAYLGNLDSENLRYLANAVYEYGDVNRAHRFVMLSNWLISRSGASQRGVHAAQAIPKIIDSYRKENAKNYYFVCAICFCLVVIAVLILMIFRNKARDLKRLEELSDQLANANSVKEAYIAQFMSLCSTYIERIEGYNKMLSRKLLARQVDEVSNIVKSDKFVESQIELFYEIFDKAFTHIYPTFVKDVNNLLIDNKTFVVGDGHKLNSELRILAFMRLGMDDSAQMARFLRLSLNTVYTYRNRMRSKAKNRETFERDIAKIGSFHAE